MEEPRVRWGWGGGLPAAGWIQAHTAGGCPTVGHFGRGSGPSRCAAAQRQGVIAPCFGAVPPAAFGRVAEPLCLGFPTCGNKYLPVKPSQLLAS